MRRGDAFPGLDTSRRVAATCLVGVCGEAATIWRFGWTSPLPAYWYFVAIATVISFTDLASRRIPNRMVLPAYLIGPALLMLSSALAGSWRPLAHAGIAAVGLAGFYLALGMAFPAGMGLGDVKWAGVIGLYLGYLGGTAVFTGTLVAFGTAAVVVVLRIVTGRTPRWLVLPMAPFMSAGALFAVLVIRL